MRACDCNDHSRTELIRRAVAEAGRGLPSIEPGMPLPAGTGLSRRSFLTRSAGLALSVYGGTRLAAAALDGGIARAAALAGNDRVLVSVFLDGGIDALSLLFPDGDPRYRSLRPKLALPHDQGIAFPADSRLLWHPSAGGFSTLFNEGKMAVMPAIGYDHPDKSHFTSRHYWEVGAINPGLQSGWLGRFLDVNGSADNPLQGLSLDTRLQPALASVKVPVASLESPDQYQFTLPAKFAAPLPLERQMLVAVGNLGAVHARSKDAGLRAAGETAQQVNRLRAQLKPFSGTDGEGTIKSPVAYPQSADEFPHRLAGLAAMLGVGLPIRCVALRAPGMYDTHANQATGLSQAIKLTADSLLSFQRDLEARKLADRVVVHVWSEFGRRASENGSQGTDHGAAGVGLLIGTQVRSGLVGEFPGLSGGLDEQGNLRATTDFRGVYSGLIEQWLRADPAPIIQNAKSFARPALIK